MLETKMNEKQAERIKFLAKRGKYGKRKRSTDNSSTDKSTKGGRPLSKFLTKKVTPLRTGADIFFSFMKILENTRKS